MYTALIQENIILINLNNINTQPIIFSGKNKEVKSGPKRNNVTQYYTSKNGKTVAIYNRLPGNIAKAKEKIEGKTREEILNLSGIYIVPNSEWKKILPNNIKTSRKDIVLSEYCPPRTTYGFNALGIDEQELLKNVIGTTGSFNLRNSSLESSGSVQYIGGDLVIGPESEIKDLSSIKLVDGSVVIECGSQKQAEEILDELNFDQNALNGSIIVIPPKVNRQKKHTKKLDYQA